MILRSKLPVFLGLAFGVLAGVYILTTLNSQTLAFTIGIASFLIGAILLKYFRGAKKNSANDAECFSYSLRNSKDVIYDGAANHFLNGKQVSGYLYLLRDKLIFQSKSFKIALKHELVLELSRVKEVSFAKTNHVLDKIIVIVTESGDERFLVKGHQLWIDELENALFNYSLVKKSMPVNTVSKTTTAPPRKNNNRRNKAV
jgi:hypothetical protein